MPWCLCRWFWKYFLLIRFRKDVAEISKIIKARNTQRNPPYLFLDPDIVPNSISIWSSSLCWKDWRKMQWAISIGSSLCWKDWQKMQWAWVLTLSPTSSASSFPVFAEGTGKKTIGLEIWLKTECDQHLLNRLDEDLFMTFCILLKKCEVYYVPSWYLTLTS